MIQVEQELRLSFLLTMLSSALVRNIHVWWSVYFTTRYNIACAGYSACLFWRKQTIELRKYSAA